jgi:hypothetical protein
LEELEECTLTCKDGIQLEAFTKLSIMKAKHKGLNESMITLEVEVVRKCEDYTFGTQYIIFQFQANVHPNWLCYLFLILRKMYYLYKCFFSP